MLFKYELNQDVKVKVFTKITRGTIVKRVLYETNLGRNFKYTIRFGEGYNDDIDYWEQELDSIQSLDLGKSNEENN